MRHPLSVLCVFLAIHLAHQESPENKDSVRGNIETMRQGVHFYDFDIDPKYGKRTKTILKLTYVNSRIKADQVEPIIPHGGSNSNENYLELKSMKEISNSFQVSNEFKFGLVSDLAEVAMSTNVMYKKEQSIVTSQEKYIFKKYFKTWVYEITFNQTAMELDPQFLEKLEKLPLDYLNAPEMYDKLVQTYGTHFISKAVFGGLQIAHLQVSQNKYTKMTTKTLSLGIKASLDLSTAGQVATNLSSTEREKYDQFTQATEKNCTSIGGNPIDSCFNTSLRQQWVSSIKESPRMIEATLEPIYNLVNNATKMEQLKLAVNKNLMQRHCQELKHNLETSEEKFTQLIDGKDDILSLRDSVLEQIKGCLNDTKLNSGKFDVEYRTIVKKAEFLLQVAELQPYLGKLQEIFDEQKYIVDRFTCKEKIATICASGNGLHDNVRQAIKDQEAIQKSLEKLDQNIKHYIASSWDGVKRKVTIAKLLKQMNRLEDIKIIAESSGYAECNWLCHICALDFKVMPSLNVLLFPSNFGKCLKDFETFT